MGLNITDMSSTVGEVQRNYLYFMQILPSTSVASTTALGGVLTTLYNDVSNLLQRLGANGLQLDMYNMKAIMPPRKTNEIAINYCGQTKYFTGTDASQKTNTLEFLQDENGVVYEFFDKLQQLSGDEKTHSAVKEYLQNLTIGIAEVSVTKNTITLYKVLRNAKITGVNATQPDKEGNGISRVTVNICWDISETDYTKKGMTF